MRKRTGPRRATLAQVPTVAPQLPTPRPKGPGDCAHRASFTAVRSPSSRALRCSLSRSSELAASALRSDSAAWAPASLTAASSLLSCCTWGGEKASKRGCNGNAGGSRGPPGHLATSLGPECSHGLAWWKQEPPHPAPGAGLHPRRPHLLLLPLLTGLPTRPASTGQLHVALGAWCSGTPSESLCTACSEAGAGGRGRRAPRGLGWAGAEGGVGSSAQSCPHAAPGLTCGPVRGRWPGEGPCRPLGQGVHLADIRVDACPEGRTQAGPWPPSPHGLSHPRLLRLLARTPAVSAREAASTGARSRAFRQARPRPGPTPAVHGDRRSTPSPVAGHGVPRPGPG